MQPSGFHIHCAENADSCMHILLALVYMGRQTERVQASGTHVVTQAAHGVEGSQPKSQGAEEGDGASCMQAGTTFTRSLSH